MIPFGPQAVRELAMPGPVIRLPDRMNATVEFVDAHVETGHGDRLAVIDAGDGSRYTYRDVLEMTNRTGNALAELGVRREERVMLLLFDSPEFVFSFFGAIKIGAVPVPTNTLLHPTDYEYMINDSRARVLVVSEALLPPIEPIRSNLKHLEHIIVVGKSGAGILDYEELTTAASAELTPADLGKDDVCFWLYSSGTTGVPKGAVHLQHDMAVAADLYAKPTLGIDASDRTFSVAKLFFAYGLGNGLYFPFRVGATTVLFPGRPEPEAVFEVVDEHQPTIFFSVPTNYARLLAIENAADRFDTSSIRLCVSAGEALSQALFDRWKERFGVEILDGIGSTEILHIFISNRVGRVKPGSTGEIVPGYEAKITDENGVEVPDGEIGDLLIKGDSTCACYWNKPEETKDTIQGHWIRTGDKYCRDEDGYLWHKGRSDDMLKVGGIWVSPVEVEHALIQHPAVLECAVVGVEDADGLVKTKAFVVVRDQPPADPAGLAAEMQGFVKGKIAKYKCPRSIEFLDELPKTATGKVQRYKLRVRQERGS
jgi:benzoate-CoA ligase